MTRLRNRTHVYFIRPIGMDGPIKIGCSAAPDRRRSTLETWSPFPLEIIAQVEGGEKLERRFHAKFTAQHKSREWFSVSADLLATIDAINAGTFDIESLPEPRRLHHGHRTGPTKGTKWSPERKEQFRIRREIKRVEAETGLVRDWRTDADLFLADPLKHGITRDERERRQEKWRAEYFVKFPHLATEARAA